MLAPIGSLLAAILTSAEASVVLPIIGIGILIAGFAFVMSNPEHAKQKLTAAFFGGGVMILAPAIATAMQGAVKA